MTLKEAGTSGMCCGGSNCPAIFEIEEDDANVVIRGEQLTDQEKSTITLGRNEVALKLPKALVESFAREN